MFVAGCDVFLMHIVQTWQTVGRCVQGSEVRRLIRGPATLAVLLKDLHGREAQGDVAGWTQDRSSLNVFECSVHVEVDPLGRHCRCAGACSRGDGIFVAHQRLRIKSERLAHKLGNSTLTVSINPSSDVLGTQLTPRRPPHQSCYPKVERQSNSVLSYNLLPTHRRTGFEPCCTWPILPWLLPLRHVLAGKARD